MPHFQFTIAADASQSALVVVEADTIEQAHDIALQPHFFQDPGRAAFAFDDGNIVSNAYLPDSDEFSILDSNATPSPSYEALRRFWQQSPLLEAYFSDFCVGAARVAGGVLGTDCIVLCDDDRNDFYMIGVDGDAYVLRHTHDGLLLADPEAEHEVLDRSADLDTVLRSAFRELGFAPSIPPQP